MTAFTAVGTTTLAAGNTVTSVDLTKIAGFQAVEKSGNVPAGGAASRRPNMLRLTYISTTGVAACYVALGATAPAVTPTTGSPVLAAWPLQRTLRFTENFLSVITNVVGDVGVLVIDVGFGDPV